MLRKVEKILAKYTVEGSFDKILVEYEESTCCICIDEFQLKQ